MIQIERKTPVGNQHMHMVITHDNHLQWLSAAPYNRFEYPVKKLLKNKAGFFTLADDELLLTVITWNGSRFDAESKEKLRKNIHAAIQGFLHWKPETLYLVNHAKYDCAFVAAEAALLSLYRFAGYRKSDHNGNDHGVSVKRLAIRPDDITPETLEVLQAVVRSTYLARDLVNMPHSHLDAPRFAKEMEKTGRKCGLKVTTLEEEQIRSLNMGGLLAVNKGSYTPPRFSILEWKPKSEPVNTKPIVLIGKGIMYDTGGLSLKPTPNSMDMMKCDMGGAAAVFGTMVAAAEANLPLHLVALIPATDNRPGRDAYVPGDVITMFDGSTVEVMNTDAEGRLVLADALLFAKRYDPELVIDVATLTGATMRALGNKGIAMMATADARHRKKMTDSGFEVHERIMEFPLWDDYAEFLKSDIADIRNAMPSPLAGTITAGKFLEYFTGFPWIHLDIAGISYLLQADSYRGKFGNGTGVRLLFQFLSNY